MIAALRPADPTGCGGGGWLAELHDDGVPAGPTRWVDDIPTAVAALEATTAPRWLWPATAEVYPRLLRAGVRVSRCHDVELAESLLLGSAGRWGEPRSLAAALARLTGAPVPADPQPRAAPPPGDGQASLFDDPTGGARPAGAGTDRPGETGGDRPGETGGDRPGETGGDRPGETGGDRPGGLDDLVAVHADQRARCACASQPGRLRLLLAAESAGALAAAEMGHDGLPWRADVHDAVLLDLLGEASPVGGPPRRLAELTERICAALGQRVRPDSPAEVLRAFSRLGITLPSTRGWVLQRVDHPAARLLLEYKERHRVWSAHGRAWRERWVRDGRLHPEYVPGGVVSGRWATRGGGALQIPRVIRRAAIADPGWTFVVADAGQLEPRILAAISGDRRLAAAAGTGDLYAALAAEAFGADRARAKVALLGAMYGQTGGQAAPALPVLRREYPAAWEYVEAAARTGERGGLVRSWLGRTCPSPSGVERDGAGDVPGAAARARGRFTRNFVVQATAAEWALAVLARLRTLLWASAAQLVFFQHDEVIVHCPAAEATAVTAAVHRAGDEARLLLFGGTPVRFPLEVSVVACYADAK